MAGEQPKKVTGGAFGQFLKEQRPALQKECAGKPVTAVVKLASERFKALDASGKAKYEAMYSAAKTKYEEALRAFTEEGGVVAKKKAKKVKGSKKEKKDPNAPKKPAGGGYGVYLAEHREEIKKVMPADHKITDLSRVAAARWKALSETEQKVYSEKFKVKQEEYKTALTEYKAANPEAEKPAASPPAKPASKKRALDESAKKEAKAKPGKRGRPSKGAAPADAVDLDKDVLEAAQNLKMESALKNLAARSEIAALKLPSQKILQALKEADGLVNPAKRALLGA